MLSTHRCQLRAGIFNGCGQSGAGDIIEALTGNSYTPLQIARFTKTDDGRFTPFYAYNLKDEDGDIVDRVPGLHEIFTAYGLKTRYHAKADLEWWLKFLSEGRVGIALVDYSKITAIPPLYGKRYMYAHFLVPVGYTDGFMLVHDPLYVEAPTRIPIAEFEAALLSRSPTGKGTNNPTQAMEVYR